MKNKYLGMAIVAGILMLVSIVFAVKRCLNEGVASVKTIKWMVNALVMFGILFSNLRYYRFYKNK